MDRASGYFPLFIDLRGMKVLVVGGGKIATRRIQKLMDFDPVITVISPQISDYLKNLETNINFIKREFKAGDIKELNPFLVIAATNDREVNRSVGNICKSNGILSIVSDKMDESQCFMPGFIKTDKFVMGIISRDGDHKSVKNVTELLRRQTDEKKNQDRE